MGGMSEDDRTMLPSELYGSHATPGRRGRSLRNSPAEGLNHDDLDRNRDEGWPYDDEEEVGYTRRHGRYYERRRSK